MDFEKLPEIIEGLETVNDWRHFGPKSRRAVAWSYFQHGCFSMVALPLCLPLGAEAMLCEVPSKSYIEYATAVSAPYAIPALPGVIVRSTGGTGENITVALTGVQARVYAGDVLPRKS